MRKGIEVTSVLMLLALSAATVAIVLFGTTKVFGGAESSSLDILKGVDDWELGIGPGGEPGEESREPCQIEWDVRLYSSPGLDCSGAVANYDEANESNGWIDISEDLDKIGSFKVDDGKKLTFYRFILDSGPANRMATVVGTSGWADWSPDQGEITDTAVRSLRFSGSGSGIWRGGACAAEIHDEANYGGGPVLNVSGESSTMTVDGQVESVEVRSVANSGPGTCSVEMFRNPGLDSSGGKMTVRRARRTLRWNDKIDEIRIRNSEGDDSACTVRAWMSNNGRDSGGPTLTCQWEGSTCKCRSSAGGEARCVNIPDVSGLWDDSDGDGISSIEVTGGEGCYAEVHNEDDDPPSQAQLTGYSSKLGISGGQGFSSVRVEGGSGERCAARLQERGTDLYLTVTGDSTSLEWTNENQPRSVKPVGGDSCPATLYSQVEGWEASSSENITLVNFGKRLFINEAEAIDIGDR